MYPNTASVRSLLTLVFGCLSLALSAQETFLSFDYPYKEVQRVLYNMKSVDVLFEQENSQFCVRYNGAITTFYFEKGVLYNIDETRTFERPQDAEQAYEVSMQYLLDLHVVPVEFCQDETEKFVIATLDDKVYRLIMRPSEAKGLDVVLSCKNVRLAPINTLEGADFTGFGEKDED